MEMVNANRCLGILSRFLRIPDDECPYGLEDIGTLKCIEYDKYDWSCNQTQETDQFEADEQGDESGKRIQTNTGRKYFWLY